MTCLRERKAGIHEVYKHHSFAPPFFLPKQEVVHHLLHKREDDSVNTPKVMVLIIEQAVPTYCERIHSINTLRGLYVGLFLGSAHA
jgi:hypothetical protein